VLHPRWYVAERVGYLQPEGYEGRQSYETVMGYRPNRHQLLKVGYEVQRAQTSTGTQANTFAMQLVTVFRPVSIARD
jgi:hypothetical protein